MLRILSLSLLLLLFFASSIQAGEKVLDEEPFNRFNKSYILPDDRGEIWIAYYDLNNGIHVSNLSKGIDFIVNEGREPLARGLAFDIQGDNVFVAWREKAEGKRLYFRAIYDGGKTMSEPVLLDVQSEPLTRIKIGSNAKGDVFVLWYGERFTDGSRYHYYIVSSNDSGRTFSEAKNLTIGYEHSIYPTLLVDEDNAYIFSYSRKEGKYYMIFRKTTDGGRTWSEPVEIKEIGVVTLHIIPIKVGERLHVFWYNSYDGVYIIEGAYSDDGGKTWKTTAFEDTRGLGTEILKVAHDSKGHIYLAMSYRMLEEEIKSRVVMIRSEDNGTTWEKMIFLRHYPFENTKATHPAILATDEEVVVVWVDHRNIRSNLYMQYSKDYGRTWQEKDIPLEEPGRFNTAHYSFTDSLAKVGDYYYVLAYRFKYDLTLKEADLLLLDFKLNGRGVQ
jgi:hypothetical protein